MPNYTYEAKKTPKEIVRGVLVADNKYAAIREMGRMGYYPLTLTEENASDVGVNNVLHIFDKVGPRDVAEFTAQLSDLIEAGFSVVKALEMLQNQPQKKSLKKVITDIGEFCKGGNALWSALSRHPAVFPRLYISMVRAGEAGGALDNVLDRLADLTAKEMEMRDRIKAALAYPVLMSAIGLVSISVLMTFVIPKIMVMFNNLGRQLPLPTRILLGISAMITRYWWILIIFAVLAVISTRKISRTREGVAALARLKLGIPWTGRLIKKMETARLTRTLATLLSNGVPMLEALEVASEGVGNAVIREDVKKVCSAVKEGAGLAQGFRAKTAISAVVVNMMAMGEEGGYLEKALFKIAERYERETGEMVKLMMTMLEPILILILGAIVGFIVISMLLPIFEINLLVR